MVDQANRSSLLVSTRVISEEGENKASGQVVERWPPTCTPQSSVLFALFDRIAGRGRINHSTGRLKMERHNMPFPRNAYMRCQAKFTASWSASYGHWCPYKEPVKLLKGLPPVGQVRRRYNSRWIRVSTRCSLESPIHMCPSGMSLAVDLRNTTDGAVTAIGRGRCHNAAPPLTTTH